MATTTSSTLASTRVAPAHAAAPREECRVRPASATHTSHKHTPETLRTQHSTNVSLSSSVARDSRCSSCESQAAAHGVRAAWAVRTTVQDAHPRHTARHATRHHGPLTHMQQHRHVIIYGCAQEASDGTRQGSSPPRRVLCVSCGEAISLLRSQPASPEQCARHAPWGPTTLRAQRVAQQAAPFIVVRRTLQALGCKKWPEEQQKIQPDRQPNYSAK